MKMNRCQKLSFGTTAFLLLATHAANAELVDGHLGRAQVFDLQPRPHFPSRVKPLPDSVTSTLKSSMQPQWMPQSRAQRQCSVRRAFERAANPRARALGTRMAAVLHGAGARHAFLGGVALVHDEGVDIPLRVAGAQGFKALAQRDARRHGAQPLRWVRKGLGAKAFEGPEVVLAQSMQGRAGIEDVADGDASAYRVPRVGHRAQIDTLEQPNDQGQTTTAAKMQGFLFTTNPSESAIYASLTRRVNGGRCLSFLICNGIFPD